jgi:hypothetical protein
MRSRSSALSKITAMEIATPTEIDAGLFMLALCGYLQTTYLDRRGIDCFLDAVGTGRLPEMVCRMLDLMVRELVKDVSERLPNETARRTVAVTLRRRGTICLCTIAAHGLTNSSEDAQPGLQRVRQLATDLHGGCTVRSMPDRGLIAIMFDIHLVERFSPAAISLYRLEEMGRRAGSYPIH